MTQEALTKAARAYMKTSMAMPDIDTDQAQNWMFGHLVTFAHRQLVARKKRRPAKRKVKA